MALLALDIFWYLPTGTQTLDAHKKENGKGRNEGTGRARAPEGTAPSTQITPGPLGHPARAPAGVSQLDSALQPPRGGPAGPQPPLENPARLRRRNRVHGGHRSRSLKPNSPSKPSQPFRAEEEPKFCPCCPARDGHRCQDATGPWWCWGPEGSGRTARRGRGPGGGDHGVTRARWHTQGEGPTDAAPHPSPTRGAGQRRKAAAEGSAPFLRILPPKAGWKGKIPRSS